MTHIYDVVYREQQQQQLEYLVNIVADLSRYTNNFELN